MITGTEIDFIVSDSLKALALYKEIFEVHVVEATKYPVGRNEVVFNLYDTRFHMFPCFLIHLMATETHRTFHHHSILITAL